MVLEKLAGISRENQKMQRTTAEAGTRVLLYRDEGGDGGGVVSGQDDCRHRNEA